MDSKREPNLENYPHESIINRLQSPGPALKTPQKPVART